MTTKMRPVEQPTKTPEDDLIHTISKTWLGQKWAELRGRRLIALCGKDVTDDREVSVWDTTTCETCAVLERAM